MKIAIVGSGISGLVCAHRLHRNHEVTLFEANNYLGGHTHTVTAEQAGKDYAVDTGFIVFNEPNYPHFTRLLDELGVESQPAPMSFSVRCERTGLEYAGTNLNTVFAQRRNLWKPAFHGMLRDILRFNRLAKAYLREPGEDPPMETWLQQRKLNGQFVEHYLLPMGAAIWSSRPEDLLGFSTLTLLRFLDNHQLLTAGAQLPWRSIRGGSARYVEAITAPFLRRIRLSTPVDIISRQEGFVYVKPRGRPPEHFDRVILANHSDEALALLSDPTALEREVLTAIPYQRNDVVLHTDTRLLPRRRRAWAAWNYHIPPEGHGELPTVTYHMNKLQSLESPRPFLVTLNRPDAIDPAQVLQHFTYTHPLFSAAGVAAQQRWKEIDGVHRTHFCGAYWGYGFHEDGVRSALRVCDAIEASTQDVEHHPAARSDHGLQEGAPA